MISILHSLIFASIAFGSRLIRNTAILKWDTIFVIHFTILCIRVTFMATLPTWRQLAEGRVYRLQCCVTAG